MVQNLVEMIQSLKVSELVSLNEELMTAFGIDKSMLSAAPAAAPAHAVHQPRRPASAPVVPQPAPALPLPAPQ